MADMVQLADPAGTHGNGRNAPIPDLRLTTMEPPGSTLKSHSWPRQRIVGSTRKRSFAPDFCTCQSPAHALCKQCLCVLQIGGVKALGEPAVDRCEQLVGCGRLA